MRILTSLDIDEIEASLVVVLPRFYRKLLIELGFGETNQDTEIYHPQEVAELYCQKFDDEDLLYKKYFPFGCNNASQELWIIDVEQDKVLSIHHETHEDYWPDEIWQEYELWLKINPI